MTDKLDKPCLTEDLFSNSWNGYYHVSPANFDGYYLLHRYIYARYHGVNIPSNVAVMHLCNNRSCIEITHLKLGTWGDNNRHMIASGRNTAIGTRNGKSLLDEDKVREIRKLYSEGGWTYKMLGKKFDVSGPTITDVVVRRTWKHVE